jgi:hypothetical protein
MKALATNLVEGSLPIAKSCLRKDRYGALWLKEGTQKNYTGEIQDVVGSAAREVL